MELYLCTEWLFAESFVYFSDKSALTDVIDGEDERYVIQGPKRVSPSVLGSCTRPKRIFWRGSKMESALSQALMKSKMMDTHRN